MILVAGGDADPNIAHIVARLTERGASAVILRVGASGAPRLVWRISEDRLEIAGEPMAPSAIFLRYDVFTHLQDGRPESRLTANRWHSTLLSWAMAHPEVAILNRRYSSRHPLKPCALHLARRHGLAIPETLVSNDLHNLPSAQADGSGWIVKPVDGGEYTRPLSDAMADEAAHWLMWAAPSFIQQRLTGPELRVYRVGDRFISFEITSPALDYRATQDIAIKPVETPEKIARPLMSLMEELGLDFGAADFKSCPETGQLLFLEVNSGPMFAGFDKAASGALSDAIIDWLQQPRRTP